MCVICADIVRGNLTSNEAVANLYEITLSKELSKEELDHLGETLRKIEELKEIESLR